MQIAGERRNLSRGRDEQHRLPHTNRTQALTATAVTLHESIGKMGLKGWSEVFAGTESTHPAAVQPLPRFAAALAAIGAMLATERACLLTSPVRSPRRGQRQQESREPRWIETRPQR